MRVPTLRLVGAVFCTQNLFLTTKRPTGSCVNDGGGNLSTMTSDEDSVNAHITTTLSMTNDSIYNDASLHRNPESMR